jgi:hypothetical protein
MSAVVSATLLPEPPPRRREEETLHRSTVQFLRWALPDDATFYHVPNGGLRSRKVAQRLSGLGVVAGVPDLAIVHRGKALFIELKAKHGTVSAAQREMIRKLTYCGAPVMLCRSVPEVEAQLREACVPLRASVAA